MCVRTLQYIQHSNNALTDISILQKNHVQEAQLKNRSSLVD